MERIDLNTELGNAAFFGHWKVCVFLIEHGAEPNFKVDATPLHNALAKPEGLIIFILLGCWLEKEAM